jgi:hypothetical protein
VALVTVGTGAAATSIVAAVGRADVATAREAVTGLAVADDLGGAAVGIVLGIAHLSAPYIFIIMILREVSSSPKPTRTVG